MLKPEAERLGLDTETVLVTDVGRHYMPPLFFDVALGESSAGETFVEIGETLLGAKVKITRALSIDAGNRVIETTERLIEYDYLIVTLGSRYGWDDPKYPGLDKYGHHNYALEGALELRSALASFKGRRLVPELPYRCGIYPYEAATALTSYLKKREVIVKTVIMTPEAKPTTILGDNISSMRSSFLDKLGIEFVQHKGLQEVTVCP
jgi:sulfide:quinone oxidoreductase